MVRKGSYSRPGSAAGRSARVSGRSVSRSPVRGPSGPRERAAALVRRPPLHRPGQCRRAGRRPPTAAAASRTGPAGSGNRRRPHPSRAVASAASATTSTSPKSAVVAPVQADADQVGGLHVQLDRPGRLHPPPPDARPRCPARRCVSSWLGEAVVPLPGRPAPRRGRRRARRRRRSRSPRRRRPSPGRRATGSGSGMASRAGPASRAARSAPAQQRVELARRRDGGAGLAVPAAVPPSSGERSRSPRRRRDGRVPFVVIVEFAHRSTAALVSETRTTRPTSAPATPGRARTRSTISWAANVLTPPPAGC